MSVEMVASKNLLRFFHNEEEGELSRYDISRLHYKVTVFTHGQVQCFIH